MNWIIALFAVVFAIMALSMIAPAVTHDPFAIVASFTAGAITGMILEKATSDRYSEDDRCRKRY